MAKDIKYKVLDEEEDTPVSIVCEPAVIYGSLSIPQYHFFQNSFNVNNTIEVGVTFKLFDDIIRLIHFSEQKLADILSLSTKSLQRYRKEKGFRFKPIHSEKLIEIAEVATFGLQVFDSQQQFQNWLDTPSFALGNKKPSELLTNTYGIKLVMEELNRIEHGIFV